MAEAETNAVVRQHLRQFFARHRCEEHVWTLGPAQDELPRLRALEFAPGPKTGLWVYVTAGAWEARKDPRLEFLITFESEYLDWFDVVCDEIKAAEPRVTPDNGEG